ncbi:triose-phosphate isomerase [Xinfangfangia sp. D13-10-4-6]|uniref:triose-phosphate isomerase n=1 Tax=Pseudogemmobacter hezensis TaxID=2737662 RepID=UPI001557D449|nr:triose-phosphate isomerase [Pseudogemmobacter hezensis]NPD15927.1 triose-phosphate isomerase [Pseudogemmobacter hezensis]
MRKLAAGNWKMNGTGPAIAEAEALIAAHPSAPCDILICPPATLLSRLSAAAQGSALLTGGQDCHTAASGAHTGDISAQMLKEAGASYVILGHSERRADHGETSALVAAKTRAAWENGLIAVVCVGETGAERDAGRTLDVIASQLQDSLPDGLSGANTVIAYEPVWAIGTGRIPTLEQIAEVHDFMSKTLSARFGDASGGLRLLYGGSVKPSNAAEIFAIPNLHGALVGGASLKASEFGAIVAALSAS